MKFLSGLSLVVLAIAALVVLSGSLKEAQTLLGPSGGGAISKFLETPLGKADGIANEQTFSALYDDARTETLGGGLISTAQLVSYLRNAEPQAQVDEPGGVSARAVGSNFEFCAPVTVSGYTCALGPQDSGSLVFASGRTLAAAQAAVEKQGISPGADGATGATRASGGVPGSTAATKAAPSSLVARAKRVAAQSSRP